MIISSCSKPNDLIFYQETQMDGHVIAAQKCLTLIHEIISRVWASFDLYERKCLVKEITRKQEAVWSAWLCQSCHKLLSWENVRHACGVKNSSRRKVDLWVVKDLSRGSWVGGQYVKLNDPSGKILLILEDIKNPHQSHSECKTSHNIIWHSSSKPLRKGSFPLRPRQNLLLSIQRNIHA